MQSDRRRTLGFLTAALLWSGLGRAQPLANSPDGHETLIRLNLPGPGSLPFLPLELIPILGFDREIGVRLLLRYQPSGIRAMEDVLAGNADFAALGFPTLPVIHARGKDVVAIAPLAGTQHSFNILVRKDLAKHITRMEDLKGRSIGISTGSTASKSYLQMVAEILLAAYGMDGHQVRWLPTAQNWEGISGAFVSKAADAIFCEQPFSTRLMRAGLGQPLIDLRDPKIASRVAGLAALRSSIATTRALLDIQTDRQNKADLMVRMVQRVLAWVHSKSPEEVARKAGGLSAQERQDIVTLLKMSPEFFSTDGRFVGTQIAATDDFLRAVYTDLKLAPAASLIESRWAGQRP
jgi:NitT/TauT family transport system substrate-binding protein